MLAMPKTERGKRQHMHVDCNKEYVSAVWDGVHLIPILMKCNQYYGDGVRLLAILLKCNHIMGLGLSHANIDEMQPML